MPDLIGRELGPYRVLEQLGVGGMATVYKAYHAAMDRYVAIKVLPEHLAREAGFRARFEREARTIARLEHRHILPVYDVAEDDGVPYLVMRFTDGGDLADLIAAGGLTTARAAELVAQVADALAYAHSLGVIHRDVKPANVLIGRDGDALLSDFGIAKIYSDTSQLTGEGMMVGTPAYMAPEQLRGQAVDARTDIYSLGVVLYQALTGECPFIAETPLAVALMHIHNPLRPPRQLNPAIPEPIERVVLRALAKNPDDRFQDCVVFARALRAAVAAPAAEPGRPATLTLPELAAEPGPSAASAVAPPATVQGASAAPRRPGSRAWLVGAGALALVIVAALAFALTRGGGAAETAATPAVPAAAAATGAPAVDARQALEAAMRQLDINDGSAALETLAPALAAHPDDASLLAARGVANAIYNGAEPARADIERALSLEPNNALAYYARGYLNGRTSKVDEAIADYTRAIELEPTLVRAYYQRASLLGYPKNDAAGKRRDLDRAVEVGPDFVPARIDRAWIQYYSDELDGALSDANYVLKLEPKLSSALYLRALLNERQGHVAEARRDFDAAVAAAPDDRNVIIDRARFLVRQSDYATALPDADRLVALDVASPEAHGLRGFILHALGREDQALAAFEQALLIGGDAAWPARYGRGVVLLAQGRAREALEDLKAAREHPDQVGSTGELFYGTSAMPSVDLARAYQALGQPNDALQALNGAAEQDGTFVVYFERGRARAASGDTAGAREDFQEALRLAAEAKDEKQRALVDAELAKLP